MQGLANDVEAVKKYAAPIHAATIHGASSERRCPSTTSRSPQFSHPFGKPLRRSRADVVGELPERQLEHDVGEQRPRGSSPEICVNHA